MMKHLQVIATAALAAANGVWAAPTSFSEASPKNLDVRRYLPTVATQVGDVLRAQKVGAVGALFGLPSHVHQVCSYD